MPGAPGVAGSKTGEQVWRSAHALDERRVKPPGPRKSIGAEVNWGVRFASTEEAKTFVFRVAEEVRGKRDQGLALRVVEIKCKGRDGSLDSDDSHSSTPLRTGPTFQCRASRW